jgi:hypothetical protein
MLTLQLPMLLALLGTALMAVVIFAPAPVTATVTTSFAPPAAPPRAEFWSPSPRDTLSTDSFSAEAFSRDVSPPPAWPALVDSRAARCDAAERLALVDALAAVRTSWGDAILHRAVDDEPDDGVRDAIVAAIAGASRRAR